ncbi:MAG: cell division protein FtsZ [Gammaproteobacteria bacterium]
MDNSASDNAWPVRRGGQPVIRVIGLGGGGTNAVRYMLQQGIPSTDYLCANTDTQHLDAIPDSHKISLSESGLGAGANPQVGQAAAESRRAVIEGHLQGADMLFIAAGMGGGTGTGAAPVVAEIARSMGILTVAVVTRPFQFEGARRMRIAEQGIKDLVSVVDSLIVIPNQKLLEVLGSRFDIQDAFNEANAVLYDAVRGITDIVTQTGMVNVDFEDLRTVMASQGLAMMGTGSASGADRAMMAAREALRCPLLDISGLRQAQGVLVNISAQDVSLGELDEVMQHVREMTEEDVTMVVGCRCDDSLPQEILTVTVVMTGLNPIPAMQSIPLQPEPQSSSDLDVIPLLQSRAIPQPSD